MMDRQMLQARDHPDETTTASWLEQRLDVAACDAFEAHLVTCSSCRAGVRVLREATGTQADPAEPVPPAYLDAAARRARAGHTFPRSEVPMRRRWLAAAATIIVMAGVAITAWRWGGPSPGGTVYRGEGNLPFGDASPRAGDIVDRNDLVFSWSRVEGADRYLVLVIATTGETLARLEAGGGQTRIAWRDLPPPSPGPLLWSVKALAFDRVLAESRPIPFDVR